MHKEPNKISIANVQNLISDGADVNAFYWEAFPELFEKCQRNETVPPTLFSNFRSMRTPGRKDRFFINPTPLMLAAFHGLTDIAQLLIQNGANVNAQDLTSLNYFYHDTPLSLALIGLAERGQLGDKPGDLDILKLLLLNGASPNARIRKFSSGAETTPLTIATQLTHPELYSHELEYFYPSVIELLLEYGANPLQKDDLGNTVLRYAQVSGHRGVIVDFISKHRKIRQAVKTPSTEQTIVFPVEQGNPVLIPGISGIRSQIAEFLIGCPEEVSAPAGGSEKDL